MYTLHAVSSRWYMSEFSSSSMTFVPVWNKDLCPGVEEIVVKLL